MNNIIKQSRLSNRISAAHLSILTDLEQYSLEQRSTLEQLKLQSKLEAKELKASLQKSSDEKLSELSIRLSEDNRRSLIEFLGKMESSLGDLIYSILNKLGINRFSPEQISNLVWQELAELLTEQSIVIKCHPDVEQELILSLSNLSKHLVFQKDNSLIPERCILEFEMAVIHIDIMDCKKNILKINAPVTKKDLTDE